jgi:uncharacterized DUF497 family protein
MGFEWDPDKARANVVKHDVSFEEAATVFIDPEALDGPDARHSLAEQRRLRIGQSALRRVLTTAYTEREQGHGEAVIRIISARRASTKERAAHRAT